MEMKDVISKPVNTVSWVLTDEKGNVKDTGRVMNQVQTAHATAVAACVDDSVPANGLYQYMHCGTGAMGGVGATNLTTAHADARTATVSTAAAAVVTTTATFAAGTCTGVLTEIGLFTTLATATMMCTATIAITKAAGDSLAVTWTVTFS